MIFGLEGREAMIANSLENPAEQIALIGEELSNSAFCNGKRVINEFPNRLHSRLVGLFSAG